MEFLQNPWDVLTRIVEEENDTFCTSCFMDNQIATRTKLLNIKYKFYGFSGDLIETITNEYINVVKLFCRGVYKLCCYV